MKTNGKMKKAGYIGMVVCFALTILLFFDAVEITDVKVDIIKYWTGVSLGLLFGNAGKHIIGGYAQAKAGNESK